MPIYEYRCKKCEKIFEIMHGMSEDPREECEACGGELERLISQTSFSLKGSGWYSDLYSSPKPGSSDSGSKSSSSDSGSKSSESSSSSGSSGSSSSDSSSSSSKKGSD